MNKPVDEQVRQIAAEVFDLPPGSVHEGMSCDAVETWDSMQHLNFVLAMEARLGVRFDPKEIETIVTVGDAIKIAGRKLSRS